MADSPVFLGGAGLSNALLAAFQELPVGVSVFDDALRVVYVNKRFEALFRFPSELCQPGRDLFDLFYFNAQRGEYGPGDPEVLARQRVGLARQMQPHLFERQRPDGTVLEVRGQPLEGGGFITTYTDVTENHRARAALEENRHQLESRVAERTAALKTREYELIEKTRLLEVTLDNMHQGITFIDGDLNVVVCNRRTVELLGFPEGLVFPGVPLETLIRYNADRGEYGPGDPASQTRRRIESARGFRPHVFRRVRPNGVVLEIRGTPLPSGGFVTTYTDVTREARAEKAVLAEKEQLKTIIDWLPGGVSMFDEKLCLIAYNQQFVDLLGFKEVLDANPMPTMEDFARFNIERGEYGEVDGEATVAAMMARARTPVAHVFERVRPNGVALEVRGTPLPHGGFVTMYTDITARRKAETDLLMRTAYLTEIIASIPQGISVFDENLRLKYWNEEFVRVLELPRDAVYRDVHFADLIRFPARRGEYGPGDPEGHIRSRVALAQQFAPHRFERTRPSGATHLVNGTPMMIQGRVAGFITTYTDITDRKRDEAAIRKLLGLQRAILDGAAYSIIATDPAGTIIEFNQGAERLLGYQRDEVVGRMTPEIFHDMQEIDSRSRELLVTLGRPVTSLFETFVVRVAEGLADTNEWTYVRRDGYRFPVLLSVTAIRHPDGELAGFMGIANDITEWKQAESRVRELNESLERRVMERTLDLQQANDDLKHAMARLVQSEKMAALGRLVAGVAHELNTPLGTTRTVASSLTEFVREFQEMVTAGTLRRSVLNQFLLRLHEASCLIERNVIRAANLVQDFKQVASDQASSRRRHFDLREVLEEMLTALNPRIQRSAVRVELDVPVGLEFDSFPGPLEQVVENLCLNAVLHGFSDGRSGVVRISASDLGEHQVQLKVTDNGEGMPADVVRRAFDPFFTTKLGKGGTGLGLYIVYTLVTGALGGQVTIESEPGCGACFLLTLPRVGPVQGMPAEGVVE